MGIVVDELAATQGTVLDIGCGNGKFLSRLHKDRPDLRVVCMDISEGILTDVGTVLVADAQTLPFAENEAEAVLALHMRSGPSRRPPRLV
ncbi:class I SAM-dependent methyltransferase [Actinacidiphila oryziradicis]|uniref:class I SAM-dependent methyltransferase n=1 Tax=Actinacidiphila oryziradicis TaxID=2571141 RepID=UPI0023F42309|nr:class I SAM-dependent methyltransferase [Actinacidiphila oryziradicis]MCW2869314.1 Methyltransferase type 11 [Actinacidiphila oryziradicis]